MKIHQLPMGARFEYEGKEYVKTGPIFGTGDEGPRLIPKYAVLKPLDKIASVAEKKSGMLSREAILGAFAVFYSECQELVPEPGKAALQAARKKFMDTI